MSGGVQQGSWERRRSGGLWRGSWDRRRSGPVRKHLQPPFLQLRIYRPCPCCVHLPLSPLLSLPRHRGHSQSLLDAISSTVEVLITTLAIKLTKHCVHVRGCYSNIEETGNLIGQNFFSDSNLKKNPVVDQMISIMQFI